MGVASAAGHGARAATIPAAVRRRNLRLPIPDMLRIVPSGIRESRPLFGVNGLIGRAWALVRTGAQPDRGYSIVTWNADTGEATPVALPEGAVSVARPAGGVRLRRQRDGRPAHRHRSGRPIAVRSAPRPLCLRGPFRRGWPDPGASARWLRWHPIFLETGASRVGSGARARRVQASISRTTLAGYCPIRRSSRPCTLYTSRSGSSPSKCSIVAWKS